jgi:energy-converting hydrogenase Eha subunit C
MRVLRSDALAQIGVAMMVVGLIGLVIAAAYGWSIVATVFSNVVGIGSLLLLAGFVAWGSRYWTLTRRRRRQAKHA